RPRCRGARRILRTDGPVAAADRPRRHGRAHVRTGRGRMPGGTVPAGVERCCPRGRGGDGARPRHGERSVAPADRGADGVTGTGTGRDTERSTPGTGCERGPSTSIDT